VPGPAGCWRSGAPSGCPSSHTAARPGRRRSRFAALDHSTFVHALELQHVSSTGPKISSLAIFISSFTPREHRRLDEIALVADPLCRRSGTLAPFLVASAVRCSRGCGPSAPCDKPVAPCRSVSRVETGRRPSCGLRPFAPPASRRAGRASFSSTNSRLPGAAALALVSRNSPKVRPFDGGVRRPASGEDDVRRTCRPTPPGSPRFRFDVRRRRHDDLPPVRPSPVEGHFGPRPCALDRGPAPAVSP